MSKGILEQYPEWFLELIRDVQDMREAQNNYFTSRIDSFLRIAKRKEMKVDEWIKQYVKEGVLPDKEASKKQKINQGDLFK